MSRLDFLKQKAPENYVAGLGRGATGFTTRSDLGPAREGPSPEQIQEALAKRAAALGAAPPTAYGAPAKKSEQEETNDDDERFQDPDNETGLFSTGLFDREDDEADLIYQFVDDKLDKRRKQRREAREAQEKAEFERENPLISEQFADLRRQLGTVTEEQWGNLPEVGDLTGKNRRTKQNQKANQRFYAVPDSVLAGARDSTQFETSVQEDDVPMKEDEKDGTVTNFADIGAARNKVLQVRMDQAAQADASTATAASGTSTTIDPKGYLTSLATSELKASEVELGDINRVRVLMDSVIKTNPKHAPGWIASARIEEMAGKIVKARQLIAQGCEQCPKSEDAWLENIRLNDNHNAKIIAANAIKNNDRSTRLWIEAMKLETEPRKKKNVLRQALDHIPQSVAIWKEAVNLEDDITNARLMLAKATETIPLSVELWLALARLETPENAQAVLNKARKANPTSTQVWIAAARLQEQMGQMSRINVMNRAIKALVRENAMLKREEWIAEAEKCEADGAVQTCGAIIHETLGWSLDEDDDRKEIFKDDAKASIARGRYETARAIYAYALRVFPTSRLLWLAAVELERSHGTKDNLESLLEKATEACPQSDVLWLQRAREKWQGGDKNGARVVLGHAFNQNPYNEEIWLAAVKLEADDGQIDQARTLLTQARENASTERVWYKSAAYERQLGDIDRGLDYVLQGLTSTPVNGKETRFPRSAKLWMMKGQIYEDKGMIPQAREAYSQGTRAAPKSIPLWLLAARLEEKAGVMVRARSVLDRARLQNPKSPELWLESIRIERRASPNNPAQAKTLMAKAKQECPKSGALWSEDIWFLQPRTQRKPISLEAIKKVDNDPVLFVTVARIFWGERKLDKAASWFEKAIVLDSDIGDTWAWYLKFLKQHGTSEKCEEVISRCVSVEPKHGEVWQRIRKDPRNVHLSVEDVLRQVAEELQ